MRIDLPEGTVYMQWPDKVGAESAQTMREIIELQLTAIQRWAARDDSERTKEPSI